jgi:hypothetical protein
MTKQAKTVVPLTQIEEQLGDQLNFLRRSNSAFDSGDTSEFRRLATTLRVLFHSSRNSRSLIEQLDLTSIHYPSYAWKTDPQNLLTETSLALTEISDGEDGTKFLPVLNSGPFPPRFLDFPPWWNEPILRDERREFFSRSDFVRTIADQDGGAHVDPEIETKYHRLLNENSIGWIATSPTGEKPIKRIERVYVRHIAFEALIALEPQYVRIVGNRYCSCNSGRKARYCCKRGMGFEETYKVVSAS